MWVLGSGGDKASRLKPWSCLVVLLWTDSIRSMYFFMCGNHAEFNTSKCGWTRRFYFRVKDLESKWLKVYSIFPIVWFTLLVLFVVGSWKFMFLSTRRSFWLQFSQGQASLVCHLLSLSRGIWLGYPLPVCILETWPYIWLDEISSARCPTNGR